jgi:aminopeptidase N
MSEGKAVFRQDYRPPEFLVDALSLYFDIADRTTVTAQMRLRRNTQPGDPAALSLDGRELELVELAVDGRILGAEEYRIEPGHLILPQVPDAFDLRVVTRIDPETNTALEGLYRSGPMICTQCEAHGFSRITYYPDRPDVLTRFTVRLEAEQARYPVLLSNGDLKDSGPLSGGRHFAVWEDPFPKPCYLFCLVAGDLACVEESFATASGKPVQLKFYVDHGNEARVPHAMASLKAAMRWDERVYGLEYDLGTYMVVAARDFNMGAMENKGLNLFNARYVLASPDSATDADYEGIESVIAHEYFHNWTGNRVTCRDWFQLSLKEGLTVFRDQSFSADMNSAAVQRIEDVRRLRTSQFAEDAGPMAHPVRPESYIEINNFYTATVYEKGSEVVRMLQTLLGEQTFVRGVQAYLAEHDGSAATIEDFLRAHEQVSGMDLTRFRRWYAQAGTPVVTVRDEYHFASGDYILRFEQDTPATPGQADKLPVPIPIRFCLRDSLGRRIAVAPADGGAQRDDLLLLTEKTLEVGFPGLGQRPTPSFLLGFSAPVQLQYGYDADQLGTLLLHEDDGFARWEAAQRLMLLSLFELMQGGEAGEDTQRLLKALQALAAHPPEDRALLAELLRLPSESYLAAQTRPLDPLRICSARDRLRHLIAVGLTGPLSVWAGWGPEEHGAINAAKRSLSNLALWYLAATGSRSVLERCASRAATAHNMTLAFGALQALNDTEAGIRDAAMAAFYERWQDDPLVLDKWFALQAGSTLPGGLERVRGLMAHPRYSNNPNRVRSVLGTFWRENLRAYHREDGEGYRLLAHAVGHLDAGNPQVAARLADGLLGWRDLVKPLSERLREAVIECTSIAKSPDVREKLEKSL